MNKAARLGILLLLVVAGGALAFAGAAPQGYKGVADVRADPDGWAGKEVELKGTVAEGSLVRDATPVTFLLLDGGETLQVRWDPAHPLPDHEAGGTIEGKNVVVHGTVVLDDSGLFVLAHDMQVGCASKYRAA